MRVNINKKIILSIIIILSITFISTISKAALEFKKNAKNEYSPLNASVAYQLCYDLKNSDSTLGINQVDPHLILNKDWTAVAFLSMSTYGKNSQYNSYVGDYQTSNGKATVIGRMCRLIIIAAVGCDAIPAIPVFPVVILLVVLIVLIEIHEDWMLPCMN